MRRFPRATAAVGSAAPWPPAVGATVGRRRRASRAVAAGRAHAAAAAANTDDGDTSPSLAEVRRASAEASARLPRFLVPRETLPPAPGHRSALPPPEAAHAARVLRLRPGAPLELCDGEGTVVNCAIETVDASSRRGRERVDVVSTGAPRSTPFGGLRVDLMVACSTIKGGRGDWLVEKAAELGAATFTPLETERSRLPRREGNDDDGKRVKKKPGGRKRGGGGDNDDNKSNNAVSGSGREARWERLAVQASRQSLRAHALRLQPATPLCDVVNLVRTADAALLAAAGGPPIVRVLDEVLRDWMPSPDSLRSEGAPRVVVVIGPEGDLTAEEQEILVASSDRRWAAGSGQLVASDRRRAAGT